MRGGGKGRIPRAAASRRLRLWEALRGAPSRGRAEIVSGCRGRAAFLQPWGGPWQEEGSRGWVAACVGVRRGRHGEGSPQGVWGDRGAPLSSPVPKVLSFPCLRAAFESSPQPPLPAASASRSYSEELKGGGSRADLHRPPTPASTSNSESGWILLLCCLLHLGHF